MTCTRRDINGKVLPAIRNIIYDFFAKNPDEWFSALFIKNKCKLGERSTYAQILTLYREKELIRKSCPCGRGYLYKFA